MEVSAAHPKNALEDLGEQEKRGAAVEPEAVELER